MTALALHFSERRGVGRWMISAVAIVLAHAAVIAALAFWYTRASPEDNVLPAIAITLAPPTSAPAPDMSLPIGPLQQEQEYQPPEPPKEPTPVEQPVDKLMPPPPQPAEVTLPKPAERVIEPKKRVEPQQKQEARAPPKNVAPQRASSAASDAYKALVSGHLKEFIDSKVASKYGAGRVVVVFVLSRQGQVLSSRLTSSSGNEALDREALAIVSRANPFPPFPAEKAVAQDSFTWPVTFERR